MKPRRISSALKATHFHSQTVNMEIFQSVLRLPQGEDENPVPSGNPTERSSAPEFKGSTGNVITRNTERPSEVGAFS